MILEGTYEQLQCELNSQITTFQPSYAGSSKSVKRPKFFSAVESEEFSHIIRSGYTRHVAGNSDSSNANMPHGSAYQRRRYLGVLPCELIEMILDYRFRQIQCELNSQTTTLHPDYDESETELEHELLVYRKKSKRRNRRVEIEHEDGGIAYARRRYIGRREWEKWSAAAALPSDIRLRSVAVLLDLEAWAKVEEIDEDWDVYGLRITLVFNGVRMHEMAGSWGERKRMVWWIRRDGHKRESEKIFDRVGSINHASITITGIPFGARVTVYRAEIAVYDE